MAVRTTPVMEQHAAAKRAHPDAIVFFRMGDFYEMFGEDAVLSARLLDLTLTSRSKGKPDEVPMAGVPHHAAHSYISKLLGMGHKVAICEQLADPSTVKGIVPRGVVRVLTPGTVTGGDQLETATNSWLAGVEVSDEGVGFAVFDVSTSELRAAFFPDLTTVLGELARSSPREIVLGGADGADGADATNVRRASSATALPNGSGRTEGSDGSDAPAGMKVVRDAIEAFQATTSGAPVRMDAPLRDADVTAALGPLLSSDAERLSPLVQRAVARAIRYARACSPGVEFPVRRIAEWDPSSYLVLDAVAERHLELVRSMSTAPLSAGSRATGTLLGVIDETKTAPGARLLRRRLLAPLTDVARIRRRLDTVEFFTSESRLRTDLRAALSDVTDLERLAVRGSRGEATPRDLGALRNGLVAARLAVSVLASVEDPVARETLGLGAEPIDTVTELADELARALVERPPALAKEGEIFREGFDAELDDASDLKRRGTELMVELEGRLKAATGISTLKIRFTRVFGWYVEITRSQATRAPSEWRRKQTVAGGERFTLPELDDLADRVTHAEDRHRTRELALVGELVLRVKNERERIVALSERMARWDVSAALAEVAHRHDYRRPDVDSSDVLEIVDGRHPVVERLAAAGRFVPNDVRLEASGERSWIVTGPNMAGKSTLLRQVALAVVLAQMGSFVPARSARIGIVDRVLSRVGASDDLSRGESTFMVEMRETAEILRKATSRSLVILDEIGRGTSTFDGLAIAWAVAEYLDGAAKSRTLFATHYHELTALAESSAHVANVSVSAEEVGGDVVFLHRLVKGPASRSYGVAVAKLAGLPESVLARARALLESLEAGSSSSANPAAPPVAGKPVRATPQLELFAQRPEPSPVEREVLATIRGVEVDRMTPLDALGLLARLKSRLE